MKKLLLATSVFMLTIFTSCANDSTELISNQSPKKDNSIMSKNQDSIIYYTEKDPLPINIANDMAKSTGLDVGETGRCRTTSSYHNSGGNFTIYHVVCGSTHWTVIYDNGWLDPHQENPKDGFFH